MRPPAILNQDVTNRGENGYVFFLSHTVTGERYTQAGDTQFVQYNTRFADKIYNCMFPTYGPTQNKNDITTYKYEITTT